MLRQLRRSKQKKMQSLRRHKRIKKKKFKTKLIQKRATTSILISSRTFKKSRWTRIVRIRKLREGCTLKLLYSESLEILIN